MEEAQKNVREESVVHRFETDISLVNELTHNRISIPMRASHQKRPRDVSRRQRRNLQEGAEADMGLAWEHPMSITIDGPVEDGDPLIESELFGEVPVAHSPVVRLVEDVHCPMALTSSETGVVLKSVGTAMMLFPEFVGEQTVSLRMVELAKEAFKLADETYSMADAEAWGDNFIIPPDCVTRDMMEYEANGFSVEALAAQRIESFGTSHLSKARTPMSEVLTGSNPEVVLLQKLANEGMSLLSEPDFVPNSALGIRPPLRPKYEATKSAVNRLLYTNFYAKGLSIVLPLASLDAGPDRGRYHLSPLSWAPKSGTPKGRPIGDCSDGGDGAKPLNSDYTKFECDRAWGVIKHPTISEIASMVDRFVSNHPSTLEGDAGDEVVIWKMDLKGAYTLLSFKSADVPLLGMEMSDGLVMFFLCGIFGWTGTPACFQVVTRAITHELKERLRGEALMSKPCMACAS